MTESQEWERIVRNIDDQPVRFQQIIPPTPVQKAIAGLVSALTVCGSITWGAWIIHTVAGWLG